MSKFFQRPLNHLEYLLVIDYILFIHSYNPVERVLEIEICNQKYTSPNLEVGLSRIFAFKDITVAEPKFQDLSCGKLSSVDVWLQSQERSITVRFDKLDSTFKISAFDRMTLIYSSTGINVNQLFQTLNGKLELDMALSPKRQTFWDLILED